MVGQNSKFTVRINELKYKDREVLIFEDIAGISDFALKVWVEASEKAVRDKGSFEAALSGGRTPVDFYRKLAGSEIDLPWRETRIFMVDERFVPFEDNASNYRMIRETLLRHVKIPEENIHFISTGENTPRISALKYEDDLISYFKTVKGEFPCFDLVLLGIGEDGHTASLFPRTTSLKETEHLAVAVSLPDVSMHDRISLTLPVINNAENIVFLVSGSSKAGIVKKILEDKDDKLPASLVKSKNKKVLFLLDREAAAYLSR